MEADCEPIPCRLVKLDRVFTGRTDGNKGMGRETLLDSLLLLYDQCSSDGLKRDNNVAHFIKKFGPVVKELRKLRVGPCDFEVQKVIGRGHFGEVRVVREKSSGDVYAMKILRKSETLSQRNVTFYEEERDIMAFARSPWITRLQYAFQDREQLYLVMEFHQGGDLLALLERHGGSLSENATRFYFAEIALAIKSLHDIGYVHRDIKPDNILIDLTGHVKLADFGSAAKLSPNNMVSSKMAVGTPEYVAPEVLASVNGRETEVYGAECDWWSLGILAYEMFFGKTPFADERVVVTYSNIMDHDKKLAFPSETIVSPEARDVVKGLLCDRDRRLDFDSLCSHKFFSLIDWDGIRDATPPFVPAVSGQYDTSNFDEFDTVPHKSPPHVDLKTRSQFDTSDLPFVGFSFAHCLANFDDRSRDSSSSSNKSALEEELVRKLASAESREAHARAEARIAKSKLENFEAGLAISRKDKENREKEFAKIKDESAKWKRLVELEREERLSTEKKVLELIKDIKNKWKQREEERFEALRKENENLRGCISIWESKCKEARVAEFMLREELKAASEKATSAEASSKSYKLRLRKSMDTSKGGVIELQRQMEEKSASYLQEIDSLRSELSNVKVALENAEESVKASRITDNELQMCMEVMDVKSQQVAQKNNEEVEELNALVADLKRKLEDAEKLRETEVGNSKRLLEELERHKQVEEEKVPCPKLRELENATAQLRAENDLLKSQIDNLNQSNGEKTQTVEELKAVVDRLEEGLKRLDAVNESSPKKPNQEILSPIKIEAKENSTLQTSVALEGRLARLETQLEKAREATVSERKQSRDLRVEIVKKDRELSDVKLDLRIAKREAKEAQESLEKMKCESEPKMREVTELARKAAEFEQESKRLNTEFLSAKKIWEIEQVRLEERLKVLGKSHSESVELRQKADQSEGRIQEADKHIKTLEARMKSLEERNRELKGELEKALEEANQLKRQKESVESNMNCLRQVCGTMDDQLKDFEALVEAHEAEEARLKAEIEGAKEKTKALAANLQKAERETKEERVKWESAERRADEVHQRLMANDSVREAEALVVRQERDYLKDLSARVTEELGAAERDAEAAENTAIKWQRRCCQMEEEVATLKEESTQYITNLQSIRETNKKLTLGLQEAVVKCESLNDRVVQLQDTIQALQATHHVEKVKLQETLAQHSKLIYFLQSQLNSGTKKKTFQDKLFGRRQKKKPEFSIVITEQERGPLGIIPPSKSIVSALALSPGSQDCHPKSGSVTCGLTVPSTERMHHNIPHRLQLALAMHPIKCNACLDCIHFGRQMSKCQECGAAVHIRCTDGFHTTCGLPLGLMDHFRLSMKKKKHPLPTAAAKRSNSVNEKKPQGWVKVPKTGKQGWEQRYMKFEDETLFFYDKEDGNLLQTLHLKAETECVVIHEAVGPTELPSTARSDLPYVFKLESTPDTTCWPSRCVYVMAPTFPEKQSWVSALQRSIGVNGGLHSSDLNRSCDVLLTTTRGLDMNCICHLDEDHLLLGAEEGLFIVDALTEAELKLGGSIGGIGPVYQISIVPELGIAVLLEGKDRRLSLASLEDLKAAKADGDKKVELRAVDDIVACHLFALSEHSNEAAAFLFAACSDTILLYRWNNNLANFCKRQETRTPEPCSCAVFTKRVLVFGVDKFYKLDLTTMVIKEFLDSTDTALAYFVYGALQLNSFPVAVLQVAPPNHQYEEFLLCFHEFGVFVDSNGRRTRKEDVKWTRLPLGFAFCYPYLFIIHFHSVEVTEIEESRSHGFTRQTFVEMSSPRYLGPVNSCLNFTVSTSGAVYVATTRDSTSKLLALYGEKAMKKANVSEGRLRSLDKSDSMSSASDFSFTSSVMQALESADESAV